MPFSQDLHVMARPARTYATELGVRQAGLWVAVRRPALVALVLGAATAVSSTGHLTIRLLIGGIVCWSFVPLLQMAIAAAIMRSAASQSIALPRRLDLWFMGHAPWSLWIIAAMSTMGAAPMAAHVEWAIMASAVVPIVWTSIIGAAFCRVVLGDSAAVALARTALQQAVTWTIALLYIAWAVALWPRIVAFFGG
jgi:hypothetical protein